MYPTTISFIGLAMASLSLAQTSTITLFIPGADPQPLVASIAGVDATATTYAIQCSPGTDGSDCGFRGQFTLTEGPDRAKYTFPPQALDESGEVAFTGYFDCSLAGTTSAVCTESFGGNEANFPGMSTETYSGTNLGMPVIITAGLALGSSGGSPSSAAPLTTVDTLAATTSAATSTTGASTATSTGSGAAKTIPSGTAISTAGVPAITGNAGWGLAGMAVAAVLMV